MRMWKLLLTIVLALPALAPPASAQQAQTFKPEEIEQMVAPIALYPDSLVAQILMAATYPLEVVEAARWVKGNPGVTGKALEDAMQKQAWDPSVKSLAAFPQVITMMNDKLDMTQRLGDAFLAQQKDVLAAVQRLRAKAQAAGNLKSGKEQTVSTAQEGGTTVIKIEPAQPTVVYVPTYNPTVVYGAWPYPTYPPYAYYPPGYAAGVAAFSFTAGLVVGSAMWGHCDWGRGDVNVNVNQYNNFNHTNIQNNNWVHNSDHRKGVQYRDPGTQQKFGRGQSQNAQARNDFRGRAEQGRQDISRGGADRLRGGNAGGNIGGQGGVQRGQQAGLGQRGQPGAPRQRGGASPASFGGGGNLGGGGGIQHAGGGASAFDGAGRGGQTRDFSNRGASSRATASHAAAAAPARGRHGR
jgi:hypothetical protein